MKKFFDFLPWFAVIICTLIAFAFFTHYVNGDYRARANSSQAVSDTPTVAASDVGADKIRVQKSDDYFIDWLMAQGRTPFIVNGLHPFGKDQRIILGLRSDGLILWRFTEKSDSSKVREIADGLRKENDATETKN